MCARSQIEQYSVARSHVHSNSVARSVANSFTNSVTSSHNTCEPHTQQHASYFVPRRQRSDGGWACERQSPEDPSGIWNRVICVMRLSGAHVHTHHTHTPHAHRPLAHTHRHMETATGIRAVIRTVQHCAQSVSREPTLTTARHSCYPPPARPADLRSRAKAERHCRVAVSMSCVLGILHFRLLRWLALHGRQFLH